MLWEKRLEKWATEVRENANIPARLILWNGQSLDFGQFTTPQVALHAKGASALPYLLHPSLDNLGEAYIKGLIDLDGRLSDVVTMSYDLAHHTASATNSKLTRVLRQLRNHGHADQEAVQYHYDVSNAFYQLWLDSNMVYSCAYFENGDESLEAAQMKKIDHILTKIKLEPEHTLLDIGCGWGALVLRAAGKFGARCVGITLSKNQHELACQRVAAAGLSDRIEIRLQDYREVQGRFDRITSVGMFEHVGRKNLPAYFGKIRELLSDDGLALNHGITSTDPLDQEAISDGSEFIDKYVFPKGEIPHISLALRSLQMGGLEAIDVENLRRHYAKTLTLWADNFERNRELIHQQIDEERFRIWRVYLAGCALAFQRDEIALYQILCQKSGKDAATLDWSRRYMYP